MKRYSVLTYIFGKYDILREIQDYQDDVEYICVTDDEDLKSETWTVVYDHDLDNLSPFDKCYKVRFNVWKYVSTDICARIDGSIEIRKSLDPIIEKFNKNVYDCAFDLQPGNDTFIHEYQIWVNKRNYPIEQAQKNLQFMKHLGYDFNYRGLVQANFVIQRKNKVNLDIDRLTMALLKFLGTAEEHIERQDQIISTFVIHHFIGENNIKCLLMPEQTVIDGMLLAMHPHRSDDVFKKHYDYDYQWKKGYFFNKEHDLFYVNDYLKEKELNTNIYVYTHKDFKPLVSNNCYKILSRHKLNNLYDLDVYMTEKSNSIDNFDSCYSEACGLYWIWKNVKDLPDFVGLNHYSTYFDFLNDIPEIKENEIVLPELCDVTQFNVNTMREHYQNCHNIKDWEICENIINEKYPDYLDALEKANNSRYVYFRNCFVMSKKNYLKYMEWLFDILFEYDNIMGFHCYDDVKKHVDSHYREYKHKEEISYQYRIEGFLAERLFNVYIMHNFKDDEIKHYKYIMNKIDNTDINKDYNKLNSLIF
ncbi:MAG: hypothetical protein [Wendovervirus sonii]|uniref:DUF4422 domain-containing protein n=1 Tax=phage Lak_Megaphage_Sonny TaxID=3109229 RepID=A0ABZ0Z4M4_9CAUD|nr:MAG: hypothetical protein [phage Lak_Megaphage_Sonny]